MDFHPKVAMGGIGGAIAVITIWLVSLSGVSIPSEVAAAFATIFSFAAGYLTSCPDVNSVSGK